MLELRNVTKIYRSKSGDTAALRKVNLSFKDNGLVFIVGKSGSGKTTLLNTIGGLDAIDSGEIIINGKKFSDFKGADYDSYRNTYVGFIFQEYNLLPEYTVEKNIMIANELQGDKTDEEQLAKLLESVEIGGLQKRKISELSGGQKQRVAIARALIKNPTILMADEPTGAIDSVMGVQIIKILKKLSKDKLVIVVSHDMELAEKYADRIIRIADGKVVEDNEISDVNIDGNVHVSESGNVTVKKGEKLSNEEVQTVVSAIENKAEITITDDIVIRNKRKTQPISNTSINNDGPKLIKSKMKLKSLAFLGVKSLTVKPFRLIVTILLSVIAFAVFGIFDTIAAYDRTNIVADVLKTGEYNAIPVTSVYNNGETSYEIGVSQKSIDNLSNETGYNFKGIYGINSKVVLNANQDVEITQIKDSRISKGSMFYSKTVNGIVEFKESELDRKKEIIGNGSYNYKLIAGVYPTSISKTATDEIKTQQLQNIAISSYLADSLIHYGMQGYDKNSGELFTVATYEDLIDQKISVYGEGVNYIIKGIVDCGDFNKKYDILKSEYSNKADKVLVADFNTVVYAGMYKSIFVGEGYIDAYRQLNKLQTGYVTQGYEYKYKWEGVKNEIKGNNVFYNYQDFDRDSVVFFNQERNGNANTTLKDNEIIINVTALEKLLEKDIKNAITSAEESNPDLKSIIKSHISVLKQTREDLKRYENIPGYEFEDKDVTLVKLMEDVYTQNVDRDGLIESVKTLYPEFSDENVKELTDSQLLGKIVDRNNVLEIKKISTVTYKQDDYIKYNVVGIYWDIDSDATSLSSFPRVIMSNGGLKKLNVATNQGYFARIVSPKVNSSESASNLASLITSNEQISFNWFRNSILTTIDTNEEPIKQFANLFLYVSIVLALFSVFMLFNYISTSIASKRKSIGVLRALGSNGGDIFKMFFIESSIIAVINAIFAVLIAFIGCSFVNAYIRNEMNIALNFALFTGRQVLIIVLACIITALLSCLIPILKISKEKPVNLISRSN